MKGINQFIDWFTMYWSIMCQALLPALKIHWVCILEKEEDSKQYAKSAAKSLQSCLTLCDPTDGSPPGSPVPGILQARTLEWAAISFSKAWKWKVKMKSLSHVQLSTTPWTAAYQAPPSMGFLRQEYWNGLPFPAPVNHILSELSTIAHPSWVALYAMAHSFTELHKPVIHMIILISFLWLWFLFWRLWN